MLRSLAALVTFAVASLWASAPARTVQIDSMDGFEKVVAESLDCTEGPFTVARDSAAADLRIKLDRGPSSVQAQRIYEKQTGRRELSVLTAVDAKTGKTITTYRFHFGSNREANRDAARAFAAALCKRLT